MKFLFDQATDVDHFHYFANEKTNKAVLAALKSDGDLTAAGFKSVQQVKDNAGALEFGPLTAAQVQEIQTIVGKYDLKS